MNDEQKSKVNEFIVPYSALFEVCFGFCFFILLTLTPAPAQETKEKIPVTGRHHPALASFDRLMIEFVRTHQVPGAALAVSKDGRLVYARGFGYANLRQMLQVMPGALFRIASLSKPITAVAILKLVEEGKLKLDDHAFEILALEPFLEEKKRPDPRLRKITIRQLLQHTGGWDREKSFDPMFRSVAIARALGVPPPAQPKHIIRYMMDRPLDFDPGTRYAYSNFGYCVLGRVIEKVTGQTYEGYVRRNILKPLGIRDMRLGKTLLKDHFPGEVHYYDGDHAGKAVFAGLLQKNVPTPYGTWCLEAMDAHGGWLASAPDLVRFASAFEHPEKCKILKPQTISLMFARPSGPAGLNKKGQPAPVYYACGWLVRPIGNKGLNTWHNGALDGTASLLVRRFDGWCWAVLFNTRFDAKGRYLSTLIDPLVHQAANQVKNWL